MTTNKRQKFAGVIQTLSSYRPCVYYVHLGNHKSGRHHIHAAKTWEVEPGTEVCENYKEDVHAA